MAGYIPKWRRATAKVADVLLSPLITGAMYLLRALPRKPTANVCAAALRLIGPRLREHKIGRDNLIAAFPDKSPAEIEAILRGAWDNLGRFAADFAHLDRISVQDPAHPGPCDVEYSPQVLERFEALLASKKPALIFAAHLGNWELPALVAQRYGLDVVVLYRRPSIGGAADAAIGMRGRAMGELVPASPAAAFKLAEALSHGRHVAMLVDQYFAYGVNVNFFGRVAPANPLIAKLAARYECPIYGTRIIRLPDNRFRADLTEAIVPARDAQGRIDEAGTMQAITSLIEGWAREYPDQWLWMHRRWRPNLIEPRRMRRGRFRRG